MEEQTKPVDPPTITVAGVTFSADQVVSVTVKIDDRRITISEKETEPARIGF